MMTPELERYVILRIVQENQGISLDHLAERLFRAVQLVSVKHNIYWRRRFDVGPEDKPVDLQLESDLAALTLQGLIRVDNRRVYLEPDGFSYVMSFPASKLFFSWAKLQEHMTRPWKTPPCFKKGGIAVCAICYHHACRYGEPAPPEEAWPKLPENPLANVTHWAKQYYDSVVQQRMYKAAFKENA